MVTFYYASTTITLVFHVLVNGKTWDGIYKTPNMKQIYLFLDESEKIFITRILNIHIGSD